MQYRSFGATQVQVSEVGLGCWQLGGDCWGEMDDARAEQILQAALDRGVNFFDTADVYGGGRSEQRLGRFVRTCGKGVFVATKLGRGGGLWPDHYDYDHLRKATETSLKNLGMETVNLTQLHCIPTEVLRRGEVFDGLRRLKQEGKIRHFGASVESVEQARLCLQQPDLASLQVIFNIFRQKLIADLFDQAAAQGVALIVRLPMASGVLAGKMTKETKFAPQDHRHFNRDGAAFNVGETFAGLPFDKGVELSDALKPLVPAGLTMAQMAMRWVLDFPAVSVVIPGATKVEHVQSNASAADLPPLSPALHQQLRDFYASRVASHIRGPY